MFQTTTETIPKCVLFSQKAKKKCKESVQYNSDLNIRMNIFSTTFHRRGVAKAFPFEMKPICINKRKKKSENPVIWSQELVLEVQCSICR